MQRAVRGGGTAGGRLLVRLRMYCSANALAVPVRPTMLRVPSTHAHTCTHSRPAAADGPEWQDTLMEVVGRRSVPQVFIGGSHVGGCDGARACHLRFSTKCRGGFRIKLLCAAALAAGPLARPRPGCPSPALRAAPLPADTMAAYEAGKLKDMLAGVGFSI